MTRLSWLATLSFACSFLVAAACAPHAPRQATPLARDTAADYEIYNPTPCEAIAYTVDQTGYRRSELARIPSGVRILVRVPPLPEGTRVVDHAIAPDGTDCERGYRIGVRRLES